MAERPVLNKAAMVAIAREARRYGHYADRSDPRVVSVTCPRCAHRVTAVRQPRLARRGPLYESVAATLDRAVVAHLAEGWC